ncbi:diguanylate cyclase (GGDEF) domain-containing protein [Marinococcus luteus]|uniref:Diguanylate cyclase (GGDEF) domain-containing protein n=1 Tax=Marinococcus luteus TaxID=1122204 RepID=A0A1H2WUW9_9BACI|nr:GGDEF domain-containing protein [Marinococcus luteus]SDW84347.1 diguanylate cyclase (GGDEF) domain-containing protein [Marinococcus luteus]
MSGQNKEMQLYHTTIKYGVYIAFIIHMVWLAGFWWLQFETMAALNVISCLVYVIAFYLMKKRKYVTCFFIVLTEVMAHAAVATIVLGWGTGFHYYMIVTAYVLFFFPQIRGVKAMAFAIIIIIYMGLYRITAGIPPVENDIVAFVFPEANMVGALCIIALLGSIFRNNFDQMIQNLHEMNRQLEHMAATDALTGLFTRRKMYELMSEKMEKNNSFYIMMIDIDYFKSINDQYGHAVGDAAIIHVSEVIMANLKNKGFVSRWGGEEFLAAAEVSDDAEAGRLAEIVKEEMNINILHHCGESVPVTVSIGIAKWEESRDIEEVINEADRALYNAKQKGRNRTTIHEVVET